MALHDPQVRGGSGSRGTLAWRPEHQNPLSSAWTGMPRALHPHGWPEMRCCTARGRACRGRHRWCSLRCRPRPRSGCRKRGKAVIPNNPSRALKHPIDKDLYAQRHLIECCISKLKHFRRVATRYEKTMRNYFARLSCCGSDKCPQDLALPSTAWMEDASVCAEWIRTCLEPARMPIYAIHDLSRSDDSARL